MYIIYWYKLFSFFSEFYSYPFFKCLCVIYCFFFTKLHYQVLISRQYKKTILNDKSRPTKNVSPSTYFRRKFVICKLSGNLWIFSYYRFGKLAHGTLIFIPTRNQLCSLTMSNII